MIFENAVHTVSKILHMDGVFMKMRIICWLLTVALMTAGLYGAQTLWLQRDLAEKTVRLHVVANSDSSADQALKLQVRDAVLERVQQLTADCADAGQAKALIGVHLDEIGVAAQTALAGSGYDVSVSLGWERFDTRYYDSFTLPAGEYPSLRIKIGAAQGRNWWCVVFPSLCTAATSEALEESAQAGGFDDGETALIAGGEEEYSLRFKTLEWLKKIADWFS